jgi:hypothetical protein
VRLLGTQSSRMKPVRADSTVADEVSLKLVLAGRLSSVARRHAR